MDVTDHFSADMMKAALFLFTVSLFAAAAGLAAGKSSIKSVTGDFGPEWNPVADPKAVVACGKARFTVLTVQLVRMEHGAAEDGASLTFVNRLLPVPEYSHEEASGWLTVETSALVLKYDCSANNFSADTLSVSVKGMNVTWKPGDANDGQLHGTVRTLDGIDGSLELNCAKQTRADLHCTEGLISRSGWTLVDDSNRLLFTKDPWPWYAKRKGNAHDPSRSLDHSPAHGERVDYYFFGHGLNFKQALLDFTQVAGKIPLPPRFTFGSFYSRYWAYDDEGMRDLVRAYVSHGVPLDSLVTDMDWHMTFYKDADQGKKDQAGQRIGWTGFTWDKHIFPEPSAFTAWCKQRGLKNTLNLHPASGTQPWEAQYEVMATAAGIDPSSQIYVPFDLGNRTYVDLFLKIMLKPLEDDGIDFWWLDWQQGETWKDMPINPTFWLNYIFFSNAERWGSGDRPLLLHRWGGLGNHRYQIGFSGDVHPSWDSLAFQIPFTCSASNVGFGYWSHDIGGHTAPTEAQLYTRWVQFGVMSPIFRPHSTKQPDNHREFWLYPDDNFQIMHSFTNWRARLVPYLYTAARVLAYDAGISILHPMYYDYPDIDAAYSATQQYMLGDDLLVAPVTVPVDDTELATTSIWVPPGEWVNLWRGIRYAAPAAGSTVEVKSTLYEMPVLVKAGAVIPLLPLAVEGDPSERDSGFTRPLLGAAGWIPDSLVLTVVPTAGNGTTMSSLYEDSGIAADIESKSAVTTFQLDVGSAQGTTDLVLHINPPQGSYPGMPKERQYRIEFLLTLPPTKVSVDGYGSVSFSANHQAPGWWYDADRLAVIVALEPISSAASVTIVRVTAVDGVGLTDTGVVGKWVRLQKIKHELDMQWDSTWDEQGRVYMEDYPSLLTATTLPRVIEQQAQSPSAALDILKGVDKTYKDGIDQIEAIAECVIGFKGNSCLVKKVKAKILAQLQS